jgi:hypothetical protein
MKRTYRTAQGKMVDIDTLILSNEQTIAIGNMNVNARGDELGPGGNVVNKRNQVMDDYYRLNTNSTGKTKKLSQKNEAAVQHPAPPVRSYNQPNADEIKEPAAESVPAPQKRQGLRGNLADAVAKQTVVEQPEIHVVPEKKGPSRI